MLRSPEQGELTSEVLDEVLQLHFALGLDVGAVHVRVEQDDGKGQDEDGVWVPELPHYPRVTDAVPLAGGQGGGRRSGPPQSGLCPLLTIAATTSLTLNS